jgi:diguanylate cyclase (GGDEF)-like protein
MPLIFKNLNVLRSTINAISRSFEIEEILESAGANLPNLLDFISLGLLWREGPSLYLYQEESCPPSFTRDVVKNMAEVFSSLVGAPVDVRQVALKVEKRQLRPNPMTIEPNATLKSHLALPLTAEGEIIGCISLNSDQPNAFNSQDLQFFSVIGYQMAASLEHFQRFISVKTMASYDTLTDLYNRRYFEERLDIEAHKAFGGKNPLSLIMVDIDHFKKVNDTLGHPEGDKILREIASLLKTSVRKKDDVVARYGGEEFILILPQASLDEASMIAERIRRMVESADFEVGASHLRVTVSLGISNFPVHRLKTAEDLVKMADLALYEAKRGGRNRVCVYQGR